MYMLYLSDCSTLCALRSPSIPGLYSRFVSAGDDGSVIIWETEVGVGSLVRYTTAATVSDNRTAQGHDVV